MRVSTDQSVSRSRRGRGRNRLAALPNPVEQEALEAVAALRARAALDAAAAAGQPVVGRNGNRRNYVTMPEYRAGRAPANKGRRFPIEVLTQAEVQALIDVQAKTGEGLRNRALIVVLWRSGLRCAEALALMPHHISAEDLTITVLCGKGGKRRVSAIDAGALRFIDAWMAERARLGIPDTAPLFCTVRGRRSLPIHDSGVRTMLKKSARKAGIQKRVHPHGLRHTHAFELSQEGVPVRVIQAQLGHENLDMTAHYIDHLNPERLIRRIAARAYPGQAPGLETAAALSAGAPVPTSAGPSIRVDPPEPEPAPPLPMLAEEQAQLVMTLLWEDGPATVAALQSTSGLPDASIRDRLKELESQGAVARAGTHTNRATIWRATQSPEVTRKALTPRPSNVDLVLDVIRKNGGTATQAQLTRAVPLSPMTVLNTLHQLHEERKLIRAGFDSRRAIIWKLAPPPVVVVRTHEYRQAPRGDGANRVLDALEALGGRGSQAELARVLGLQPNTVRHHCLDLVKKGMVERVGLDKSTSNRGSQLWAIRTARPTFTSLKTSYQGRELRFAARR